MCVCARVRGQYCNCKGKKAWSLTVYMSETSEKLRDDSEED